MLTASPCPFPNGEPALACRADLGVATMMQMAHLAETSGCWVLHNESHHLQVHSCGLRRMDDGWMDETGRPQQGRGTWGSSRRRHRKSIGSPPTLVIRWLLCNPPRSSPRVGTDAAHPSYIVPPPPKSLPVGGMIDHAHLIGRKRGTSPRYVLIVIYAH